MRDCAVATSPHGTAATRILMPRFLGGPTRLVGSLCSGFLVL